MRTWTPHLSILSLAGLLACDPAKTQPGADSAAGRDSHVIVADDSGGVDSQPGDSGQDSAPTDTGTPIEGPGAACGLVSDLATVWFSEGDTVSFTVSCCGSLATEDAAFSAVSLPSGASFDSASRSFTWETGPADGGRIDVTFSTKPTDSPSALPTTAVVTFWVADNPENADNVAVDPTTYTEEWGLPVVHVTTGGGVSTSYTSATVYFEGATYTANIKIRGASSAYYPKPSYMMEFNEDEIALPAWGVHRNHLALLTTFDDNSYVRQKLIFDQWAAIADYWGEQRLTPRTFFAVLYLNGSYRGLYVALDRIDDEFIDQMGFNRDANLYKATNHNANFYLTNAYGVTKSYLYDGYTKEEGDPETDFSDLEALVSFTGNASASTLVDGASDWIDLQEFMDWFLLVHYSTSEDSAGKNSYLYNVPSDTGFRYAPWDFNHSWGQGWYTYRITSDYLNYFTGTNRVFWAIQSDTDANAELWERFTAMREGGPYTPEWITGTVDEYYALIQPSAERDWKKWSSSYRSYSGWSSSRNSSGDWTNYEDEKAYLYKWLDDRAELFEELHP